MLPAVEILERRREAIARDYELWRGTISRAQNEIEMANAQIRLLQIEDEGIASALAILSSKKD